MTGGTSRELGGYLIFRAALVHIHGWLVFASHVSREITRGRGIRLSLKPLMTSRALERIRFAANAPKRRGNALHDRSCHKSDCHCECQAWLPRPIRPN